MTTYDADFWEGHYRTLDPTWGTTPNAATVATVPRLFAGPGEALELGAGHGGDALWLAGQGWRVTALDVAATAVDRIAARAAEQGLAHQVRAVRSDAARDPLPRGPVDLVLAVFFSAPEREGVLRRAAASVRPGGALLLVDHGSSAPWSWSSSPHDHPAPAELVHALDLGPAWVPELLDTPRRLATGPGGRRAEVVDTVVAMRRRAA
ncbi:SAM-dependent methyltransferase [Cellulosimicrobium cellulans]|uniref:SAM-dependent methyltransferase n=1 Tax=Cellulosimicrobium cellulans TaxID=1710 RepID=UPI0008494F46|nr:class I SAM-dependent methyltransferase [Cellulosimicrobium cellulans]